jgi:predicted RNase H-like nuclease
MFIGIDGCKAGWLAVILDNKYGYEIGIFTNIEKLWNNYSDSILIFIDIPIGLPGREMINRNCDLKAREILGPKRGSCVFPAPCREAVYTDNYMKANNLNRKILEKGLSLQAWNISHKIREADMFLRKNYRARKVVRESHPEICFWALAGKVMKNSKKKKAGRIERLEILKSVYNISENIYNSALEKYKRKDVARDDIIDAICLAISAKINKSSLISIPQKPEIDKKGLRMEIVYSK